MKPIKFLSMLLILVTITNITGCFALPENEPEINEVPSEPEINEVPSELKKIIESTGYGIDFDYGESQEKIKNIVGTKFAYYGEIDEVTDGKGRRTLLYHTELYGIPSFVCFEYTPRGYLAFVYIKMSVTKDQVYQV